MAWAPPPIETDLDAATGRILAALRARIPGYETVEGDPLVVLAEEVGREYVLLGNTSHQIIETAVASIGETVFGVPAAAAASATIAARVAVTTAGPIPAGFTVLGTDPAGVEWAFVLPVETPAVPPHVDVTLTAVVAGSGPGSVPAGVLRAVTATANVSAVTATAGAVGGVDAEPRASYLDRLTDYLQTLRPGGVRGDDLAALARTVPGVHRALGVDLYDPATPSVPVERSVTLFCVDAAGAAVAGPVAAQVAAVVADAREVNFHIWGGTPTYTPVAVTFTAVAEAGYAPAAVEAAVVAAVEGYLSPATWGASGSPRGWTDSPTVRFLDVARVAGGAAGVAYLSALTINGGTVDVTLPGPAALPAPVGSGGSSVTGAVS